MHVRTHSHAHTCTQKPHTTIRGTYRISEFKVWPVQWKLTYTNAFFRIVANKRDNAFYFYFFFSSFLYCSTFTAQQTTNNENERDGDHKWKVTKNRLNKNVHTFTHWVFFFKKSTTLLWVNKILFSFAWFPKIIFVHDLHVRKPQSVISTWFFEFQFILFVFFAYFSCCRSFTAINSPIYIHKYWKFVIYYFFVIINYMFKLCFHL